MILLWDKNIFFSIHGLRCPLLDYFLGYPTRLGETVMLLSFAFILFILFDRKNALPKFAVLTAGLLAVCWVNPWLKELFERPRPFILWENVHVLFYAPRDYAFPSGHTATVFAAAFLLNYLYPGRMAWTYAVALWIAITRIYVGIHYPTDLLAGALEGIVVAFLCCWLLKILGLYNPAQKNIATGRQNPGQE